ncbi:hypothetical protein BpHYR1_013849 [Brachionus plicatilis]|uniref:Uncharacterized protein n=1 Tax=Brachionus plicatilis TaxID=10195 RepID=A0A3M7RSH7_BRAPC|nr:hypothetical protein BpHYR1_013849 [Brachionus plicatilis]
MSLCVPSAILIMLPKYVDSLIHSIFVDIDGDPGIQFSVYAHKYRFGPFNFEPCWFSVVRQILCLNMQKNMLLFLIIAPDQSQSLSLQALLLIPIEYPSHLHYKIHNFEYS